MTQAGLIASQTFQIRRRKDMLNHWSFRGVQTALLLTVMTVVAGSVLLRADDSKLLKKDELRHLITTGETAQDHQRLAAHFTAKADQLDAEAKEHEELAQFYRKNTPANPTKYPGTMQTFNHCDSLSQSLKQAAESARQLAADHREMAKEAAAPRK
jgi:uncharacterized membrane-anchored protein YhcB (DUF1043 family)